MVGFQYADKNGEGELYLDKTFCARSLACGLYFWDFCHCNRIMEMIKNCMQCLIMVAAPFDFDHQFGTHTHTLF